MKHFVTCSLLFLISLSGFGQVIVTNSSFEGPFPLPVLPPLPWARCMIGSSPDTQPGFGFVNKPPTDGSSYVGFGDFFFGASKEGVEQKLTDTLRGGILYSFTIDAVRDPPPFIGGGTAGTLELQFWAHNTDTIIPGLQQGVCDTIKGELLWSSGTLDTNWRTFTVEFCPSKNYHYIMFLPQSFTGQGPYMMIDNMSPTIDRIPPRVWFSAGLDSSSVECSTALTGQMDSIPSAITVRGGFSGDSQPGGFQSPATICSQGTWQTTVIYPPDFVGTDQVIVEAQYPNHIARDTIMLFVNCPSLDIPNLVTPNNDGKNDLFFIADLPVNSILEVYNRWGREVFKSINYQNDWNSESVADGTYFYLLTIPTGQQWKGWIQVMK